MSDVMFYGVLRMPYKMVVANNFSLIQFYSRAQEAANRVESAEAELNVARALLREVADNIGSVTPFTIEKPLAERIRSYLDVCDTLEGNKPVEATGCRKCGDILPDGHYCKAPDCPLNPQMKGK